MTQICTIQQVRLAGAEACRERKQRIAPEEYERMGLNNFTKWWLEGYDMQEEKEMAL